jgi:hypothetical protein
VNSKPHEINEILLAGDYPRLEKIAISRINNWLKRKFGSHFQCKSHKEASILLRSISAWTRHYKIDIQSYIDNGTWKGQKLDILTFQEVVSKEVGRPTKRKNQNTIKKMLSEMLCIFSTSSQSSLESAFEKNKLRNFIASSKLEGIYLEDK